jgi:DNA-binding PadR family transcriptional regulator
MLPGLTKGNLSVQLTRLDEAGLIDIEKTIRKNRTNTSARMTREGRYQLGRYWRLMDEIRNSGKQG